MIEAGLSNVHMLMAYGHTSVTVLIH